MAEDSTQQNLIIRNENVQRIYDWYTNSLFFVNRRYQRKLIWTLEEKVGFVDSLINKYPVPLILLADTVIQGRESFEIIDGMQRLNAIVSFIEGEFQYNGKYFDLDTMAESKARVDMGELIQKEPKLERDKCVALATYVLPISVYSMNDPQKIDDIFIRINSYGKHLSRQELRAAGTLEDFGDLVRVISSEIRTDVSHDNILELAKMKDISITNIGLDYGINVEDVFWVKNRIIDKEMVRESKDEEIVADLISVMAVDEIPNTSSNILDEYYGLKKSGRTDELATALNKIGIEVLKEQFLQIYDVIRNIIINSKKSLIELIFVGNSPRIPRYFQVVFLAIHKKIYKENKEVASFDKLIELLTGISEHIRITEGGNWSAHNRKTNVDSIAGILSEAFKDKTDDPAAHKWLTQFETLLSQSRTEQPSYDFKQGFYSLDGKFTFNEANFNKIIKTLTAIANISANKIGYVCVGVADTKADSDRVKELYNIEPIMYKDFYITGVTHEITTSGNEIDAFYKEIIDRIKQQPITEEVKDLLCRNIRLVRYHDKDVIIFTVKSLNVPMIYDGKYYVRHGSHTNEVAPQDYPSFFTNYK